MSRAAGEPKKRRKWRAARAAAVFLLIGIAISVVLFARSNPPAGVQGSRVYGSAIVDLMALSGEDEAKEAWESVMVGKFRAVIVAPGRLLTVHHGVGGKSGITAWINGEDRLITGFAYADAGRDIAVLSYMPRFDDPEPMRLAEEGVEPPGEVMLKSFSQGAERRLRVEHVDRVPGMGRMLVLDRDVENGMSGSPVVGDDGVVWGVMRASWGRRSWAACVTRADLDAVMSDELRRANQIDNRADVERDLARSALKDGDGELAIEHARRAVELSEGGRFPKLTLIDAYLKGGKKEEAARLLREVAGDAGESLCLNWWVADRLGDCGLWEESLPVARRAAEMSGGRLMDQLGVTECLLNLKRYDEVVEILESAEGRERSGGATAQLAQALFRSDKYERCIELGADGSVVNGLAALFIGRSHIEFDEYKEAEPWLRRSCEEMPKDMQAWDSLVYVLGMMRKPEAEEAGKRLVELDSGSSHALYRLGWVRLYLGRFGEAKKTLEAAVAAYGESPPLWVKSSLGNACFWLGEYEEARAWYRKSGEACAIPYVVTGWVESAERVRAEWEARRSGVGGR